MLSMTPLTPESDETDLPQAALTLLASLASGEPQEGGPERLAAALERVSAGRLEEHLRWHVPTEAPSSRAEVIEWLHRLELLDLARLGAAQVTAGSWPAGALAGLLDRELVARQGAVEGLLEPWWYARSASRRQSDTGLAGLRPWSWVRTASAIGVLDRATEGERLSLLQAWAQGALHPEDEARLAGLVATEGPWQLAYRALIGKQLQVIEVALFDLDLEIAPLHLRTVPLPHLGRGARLRVESAREGTVWRWNSTVQGAPRGATELVLRPGPELGEIRVRLVERQPAEREQAGRVLKTLGAIVDGVADDESALRVALSIVGWAMTKQDHLAVAARDFREGTDHLEGPWVRRLIEVRSLCEQVLETLAEPEALGPLAAPLQQALAAWDRGFAPHRDAVWMLSPTEREELAGNKAPPGAWWQPELDESFEALLPPHESFEELPPPLPEPRASGPFPSLPARASRPGRSIRLELASPAAMGSVVEPEGHRHHWVSEAGWTATMDLPGRLAATTSLVLAFDDLPDEASEVRLAGITRPIERAPDDQPLARFLAAELVEAQQANDLGIESLAVRVGDEEQWAHLAEEGTTRT
jgi:hypothetical protein